LQKKPGFKALGLILLLFTAGILLTGCPGPDPDPETEIIGPQITIENIDEPEHVEEFTLTAESDDEDTYSHDEFDPEDVEDGVLEHEFSIEIIETATVGLDIDNEEIPEVNYEDPGTEEVALDDYEATFELEFEEVTEEGYEVMFEPPPQGIITARHEGELISSGEILEAGEDVEFEVLILEEPRGYEVEHWLVNDEVLTDEDDTTYVHEDLNEDVEVTVELEETSFFAVEMDASCVVGEEKIDLKLDYLVENQGLADDTQDIEFAVDGDIEDEKEVTLDAGEEYKGEFFWEIDKYDEIEYEMAVISEDDRDEVKVKIEYVTGELEVDVIWELPPSAPENVGAELFEEEGVILIDWEEVDEADEYNIVRQQPELADEEDWRVVGTTQETFYLDKEVETGREYRYAVIAVNGDKTSDYSEPTEDVSF